MLISKFISNFVLAIPLLILNNNDTEITQIKNQFSLWQKHKAENSIILKNVYHIYSGYNYENEYWTTLKDTIAGKIFEQIALFQSNKLGIMFEYTQWSPSGDWLIKSEHYFWPSGELFFIFWSLNTSQADEPLTVEKRLYFDKLGNKIKYIKNIYKLNTKASIKNIGFMDPNVDYWININKLPFIKFIDTQYIQ
jgi:hypothetical protein